MGAWTFVEPNLEWVLDHIGAKAKRAALCRPAGVRFDRDGPHEQAHAGAPRFPRRSIGVTERYHASRATADDPALNRLTSFAGLQADDAKTMASRSSFRRWASRSPKRRSANGSRRPAMRSRPTSRWSSSKPTRSRSKSRRRPPACSRDRRQARRDGQRRRGPRFDRGRRLPPAAGRAVQAELPPRPARRQQRLTQPRPAARPPARPQPPAAAWRRPCAAIAEERRIDARRRDRHRQGRAHHQGRLLAVIAAAPRAKPQAPTCRRAAGPAPRARPPAGRSGAKSGCR